MTRRPALHGPPGRPAPREAPGGDERPRDRRDDGHPAGRVRRIAVGTASPLAAGLLVAASLPPSRAFELAPVGIALLAHSTAHRTWRRRLVNGALAGVGQFALACSWVLQFTAVGYVAIVAVEAAFVSAACTLAPGGRGRVPGLAAALVLAEWARSSWPFGGMPIGGVALGEVSGPLLALARIGGPLLVVGGTALAGTALAAGAAAALGALSGHGARRDAIPAAICAIALLVLVAAAATVATYAPDGGRARGLIGVAAVQGGGRRGLSELEVPAATVLAAQLAATSRLSPGPQLVVWPEDAVSLAGPLRGSPADSLLAGLARHLRATLVAGVTEPAGALHFRNEAVAWGPSGRIAGSFEKVHPVPFGEYVPWRALLSRFVSFAAVPRDAVPGRGTGELATPAARLAIVISYETFFPARGRAGVRAGGELLVVPTNTASYVGDAVPEEELAASRLQAVAEGRDLVQAASTGYSAVVDRRGHVLARSALGLASVVRGDVQLFGGSTLYDRAGDAPTLAGAAGTLAICLLSGPVLRAVRRRARRRASRRAPC